MNQSSAIHDRLTRTSARVLACALLFCSVLPAADYFPPPDTQGGWRKPSGAAEARRLSGMDIAKLDEAFKHIQDSTKHGGLLVARNGWLVYEKYFAGETGRRRRIPRLAASRLPASPWAFS